MNEKHPAGLYREQLECIYDLCFELAHSELLDVIRLKKIGKGVEILEKHSIDCAGIMDEKVREKLKKL